jgi:hypothetical protein
VLLSRSSASPSKKKKKKRRKRVKDEEFVADQAQRELTPETHPIYREGELASKRHCADG